MITYVNTVLVSNKATSTAAADFEKASIKEYDTKAAVAADVKPGSVVFYDATNGTLLNNKDLETKVPAKFKIGVVTSDASIVRKKDGSVTYVPVIKYSNVIDSKTIKSAVYTVHKDDVEENVTISFKKHPGDAIEQLIADGGVAFSLRLTFKDMPTRYRRWTETYSYVTEPEDTIDTVMKKLAEQINKEYKRARVRATYTASQEDATGKDNTKNGKVVITALLYDDDEQAVTENVYGKVRFDVNMYYTNSKAPGWAANNKYSAPVTIKKVEGTTSPVSAKLVRDRERAAFDYLGVLHRGCWYDPQPKMVTDINAKYDGVTIEFENAYHTADDLMRQTKQNVELYALTNATVANTYAKIVYDAVAACAAKYAPGANLQTK